jgi:CRISPR-associated protein Cst2
MTKKIASISISGEITLNMHSLNNEGGEGNQIMTRQLTIVDKKGQEHTVTGISGDMFKHIHAGHLVNHCIDNGIELSQYSKALNPNRISSAELLEYITASNRKNEKAGVVIDALINSCAVCDTHGILITDKVGDNKDSSNTPRKSVIEFGWTVGIPGKNNTETYLHTKFVHSSTGVKGESSNEGQNIFHRPANYGAYAFVCNIDAFRIGFNDIDRVYSIDDTKRKARYKAILQALMNSFLNPRGAMTSSQKPHITDFKGVVSYSEKLIPAPTISPLNPDYENEIQLITANLNEIENSAITTIPFNGLSKLSEIIKNLIIEEPYKMS